MNTKLSVFLEQQHWTKCLRVVVNCILCWLKIMVRRTFEWWHIRMVTPQAIPMVISNQDHCIRVIPGVKVAYQTCKLSFYSELCSQSQSHPSCGVRNTLVNWNPNESNPDAVVLIAWHYAGVSPFEWEQRVSPFECPPYRPLWLMLMCIRSGRRP